MKIFDIWSCYYIYITPTDYKNNNKPAIQNNDFDVSKPDESYSKARQVIKTTNFNCNYEIFLVHYVKIIIGNENCHFRFIYLPNLICMHKLQNNYSI